MYHEGGYSLFRADITDLCDPEGANLLAICVSNVAMSNVYPQFADFTFYGGLYRGVNLVSVARQHFDLDYYGAPGVMVTPVSDWLQSAMPDEGKTLGRRAGVIGRNNATPSGALHRSRISMMRVMSYDFSIVWAEIAITG